MLVQLVVLVVLVLLVVLAVPVLLVHCSTSSTSTTSATSTDPLQLELRLSGAKPRVVDARSFRKPFLLLLLLFTIF